MGGTKVLIKVCRGKMYEKTIIIVASMKAITFVGNLIGRINERHYHPYTKERMYECMLL